MASFYQRQLLILSGTCASALVLEQFLSRRRNSKSKKDKQDALSEKESTASSNGTKLMAQYLLIYGLVMGADWLQGPYVYSLYHDQYNFSERIVAILFVVGFLTAAVTAPVIGVWADKHGRRKLCLAFCITYTLACLLILTPSLPLLFLGRILGGTSTSILFSAFESWLISSSTSLSLPQSSLSNIMGKSTLINGFVATAAGVASDEMVGVFGSYKAPFIASGCLLLVSWVAIKAMWGENYGNRDASKVGDGDLFQVKQMAKAWKIVRKGPTLMILGLTQTCFEGSMYIFVFLWVPSLQESHSSHPSPNSTAGALPLGYIFSAYMICMMLGSLFYTFVSSRSNSSSKKDASSSNPVITHAKLSSFVCFTSGLAFLVSIAYKEEHIRFWAFCVFEACVGCYYPVQGMLRGSLVGDEFRATISSLFRVPLNIFVVISLMTGVSSARHAVLMACSGMLMLSALCMWVGIVRGRK